MPSLGGPELLLIIVLSAAFAALPASLITWRRGGSGVRTATAFLIGLIPYAGWVAAYVIAFTTHRSDRGVATMASATSAESSTRGAAFCGSCGARRAAAGDTFCRACGRLFRPTGSVGEEDSSFPV